VIPSSAEGSSTPSGDSSGTLPPSGSGTSPPSGVGTSSLSGVGTSPPSGSGTSSLSGSGATSLSTDIERLAEGMGPASPAGTADAVPAGRSSRDLGIALLWVLAGLVIYGAGIGSRDLWDPDEPRYAEVAREMRVDGQWIVPHVNGRVYGHKPPLFFWAIAGFSFLTGQVDSWSARAPSVLAASALLGLTYLFGLRWFGRRAAVYSTGILASTYLYLSLATHANIDATHALFTAGALFLWFESTERDSPRLGGILGAWALAGLALLTKGVGVLLVLLTAMLYLAWSDRRRSGRLVAWNLAGLALALAVAALWYVPAWLIGGAEYAREIGLHQTFTRATDPWSHERGLHYFFWNFPLDTLPWSLFLPAVAIWLRASLRGVPAPPAQAAAGGMAGEPSAGQAAAGQIAGDPSAGQAAAGQIGGDPSTGTQPAAGWVARVIAVFRYVGAWVRNAGRADRPPAVRFLVGWFAVVFVFFSAVSSKRQIYLLPLCPAFALLTGAALAARDGWERWTRVPGWILAGVVAVVGVAGLVYSGIADGSLAGWAQDPAVAEALSQLRPAAALGGLVLLGHGAALARMLSRGSLARFIAVVVSLAGCTTLIGTLWVMPVLDPIRSARSFSEGLRAKVPAEGPIGSFRFLQEEVVFYSGRYLTELDAPDDREHGDRELALELEMLDRFLAQGGPSWVLLRAKDVKRLGERAAALTEVYRGRLGGDEAILLAKRH